MKKLIVGDFFSGIGMFSFGLEQTGGFETAFFVENKPWRQGIIKQHWPIGNRSHYALGTTKKVLFDNIEKTFITQSMSDEILVHDEFNSTVLEKIDVFCGGYPCPGHSVAGSKKGFENEESKLWHEYFRLIETVGPKWVIIENSANLRNTGLTTVLQDLWSIGYNAEWHVIQSNAVGGISRRERIFIIAHHYEIRLFPEATSTKEEKSEWWTETRATINSRWPDPTESCGTYFGHSEGLDETERKERVAACGDSLDWRIPFVIGNRILEIEQNS